MELLNLTAINILLALTWWILLQKGALLQSVALYFNTKVENQYVKKAFMCPYCFAGQLGLWMSLWIFIMTQDFTQSDWNTELFLCAPISINVVFLIIHFVYLKAIK